jgi:peptidoglycan/LPS O-acetylase OafA/YrhL
VAEFWLAVAASYLLAIASWNLLEKPFLRLKKFLEFEPAGKLETSVPAPVANDASAG